MEKNKTREEALKSRLAEYGSMRNLIAGGNKYS